MFGTVARIPGNVEYQAVIPLKSKTMIGDMGGFRNRRLNLPVFIIKRVLCGVRKLFRAFVILQPKAVYLVPHYLVEPMLSNELAASLITRNSNYFTIISSSLHRPC